MKLDRNSITTGVVILLITYFILSMLSGGKGGGGVKGSASVSLDPAMKIDLGNSGVGSSGGDFVGMYSANLTGGVKVNYPWPLQNGPELGFDISA